MKKKLIIIGAVIVIVVVTIILMGGHNGKVEFKTAEIQKGNIESLISTTGTINPVNTVEVGSQVSGNILKIYTDFNSTVTKGQLLAEIDPSIYEARIAEARANLLRGEVTLKQTKISLERGRELYKQKFISDSSLEDLEFSTESAAATLEQIKANYNLANTNLENCKIFSPIDGVVISRNIDVGQTVAASFQAPTLFLIAQDLKKMQIEVNIDEADIGRIKVDQSVKFDVDAFPEEVFKGKVVQIRLQPEIISNVVTYTVIVEVDNSGLKLKPGMTANVSVIEAERKNVLKLPVSTLKFRLPEDMESQYAVKSDQKEKELPNPPRSESGEGQSSENAMREEFRKMIATGNASPEEMEKIRKKFEARMKAAGVQARSIWIMREDGKLEKRRLILGISDGDFMEIVRGNVKDKDKVVTEMLLDGNPFVVEEEGGFRLPLRMRR